MIVTTNSETYSIFKYLSLVIPQTFEEKISEIFKPSHDVVEKKKDLLRKRLTIADAKKKLANARFLTLGITQNCNLRCHYCVYGGKYSHSRSHSSASMDIETVKKAIDFYFQLINSPSRNTKDNIHLSFYGGEPLIEFNNILKGYDYAKEKNLENVIQRKVLGFVTTNGLLLSQERAGMLLDNDFIIDVSLDGPKDQHDMFRTKADNRGSFDEIFSNIVHLQEKYPGKYLENVRFQLTIHPEHDVNRLEDFFLSKNDYFNEKNVMISIVEIRNLVPQYRDKWLRNYLELLNQINTKLDKDRWFYKKIARSPFEKHFTEPTRNLSSAMSFTGTCFPGIDKMFVDADGSIHICEKITAHFPIGHIDRGFDYEAILNLFNNWNEDIIKQKCWCCEAWWLCGACFASRNNGKSIGIESDECKNFIKSINRDFMEFLTLLEKEDEIKHANRYSDIPRYLDSL